MKKILLLLCILIISLILVAIFKEKDTTYVNPVFLFNASLTKIYKGEKEELDKILSNPKYIPNMETKEGITLLIAAALKDDYEMIELLHSKGEDYNYQNKNGETMLMYSAMSNIKTTIKLLKNDKVNKNLLDNGNNNFLHYLTINKNEDLINKLKTKKEYKKYFKQKNDGNFTPLELQIKNLKEGLSNDN